MFLMSLGLKIGIIVIVCLIGLYLLFCLFVGIVFFNIMLKREKNSFKEGDKLLDFNIVGVENSELFPDVKKLTDAQRDLAEQLKNREYTYLEEKSDRGLKLAGWYLKGKQADKNHPKVVIFSHGWKSCGMSDCAVCAPFYFDEDYDVLLVDHQAHGHSEGKYLGFGILDSESLLKWVKKIDNMHNGNCDIYLHGVSMGANTLMLLNGMDLPKSVKAMCADCGFTSGYEELGYLAKARHLSFLLTKQIIWLLCIIICHYNLKKTSLDSLKCAKVPMLFIHGDKDNFVPMEHTLQNYEACASPKELKIFSGATHATCYIHNKEEYKKTVLNFFNNNN